ncbi:MAG: glycosyltransferase family 2 protein [Balneolales bacterium]
MKGIDMNKQPLVSIIMPFFNVEDFITEAVDSVMNQSYENWELFLIDDGSKDDSSTIARDLANSHAKIKYLHHDNHENKGAGLSRNLGLSKANGKFIALLDSDDAWLPGKLAYQVDIKNKYPEADMICGATLYWNSWAGKSKKDKIVRNGCTPNIVHQPPVLMNTLYPLGEGTGPCVSSILIKRDVAIKLGGFLDAHYGLYEDQLFLTKVYLFASVYVSDKCYDKYRLRPESICGTTQSEGSYHIYRLRYLNWLKGYLKENDINFKAVKKALKRNLIRYEWPKYYKAQQLKKRIKNKVKTRLQILVNS